MAVTMHLAYLCSGRLETWRWRRGVLSPGPVFHQEGGGVDAFADYVVELGRPPIHLLADLVEEDFHRVLLPHVRGRAGRKLLARRLHQHYRETPYRRAIVQGRQAASEGTAGGERRDARRDARRDDIVLMSALTNPLLVQPWTEALTLVQAPLAGIWSAAQLYTGLPQLLGHTEPHVLLVTFQRCGMRQSYFQDGQLKFSRLVPAVAERATDCALETARTRQFLISAHLLQRGDMLHTLVLAQDEELAALARQCIDGPESAFHFMPLAMAMQECGLLEHGGDPAVADGLLLHLLAGERPPSHYPTGEDGRYFRLWRTRMALYGSSMALAACALLWSGANLWAYAQANVAAGTLVEETRHYAAHYRGALAPLPPAPAPTADMRAAVLVDRLLAGQGPAPMDLLTVVSAALERAPQVQLVSLAWQVEPPANGVAGKAAGGWAGNAGIGLARGSSGAAGGESAGGRSANSVAAGGASGGNAGLRGAASAMPAAAQAGDTSAGASGLDTVPSALLGIPVKPRQSLRLEAEVRLAQADPRRAVDSMNGFAQDLARERRLVVAIEKPVLDVRPDVKLSGRAATEAPPPAPFTLRLEYTP